MHTPRSARSVDEQHERTAGLVHRALKPANVLLSPAGAKVIDFGIAQELDSTPLTSTSMIIGTPDYIAPE